MGGLYKYKYGILQPPAAIDRSQREDHHYSGEDKECFLPEEDDARLVALRSCLQLLAT